MIEPLKDDIDYYQLNGNSGTPSQVSWIIGKICTKLNEVIENVNLNNEFIKLHDEALTSKPKKKECFHDKNQFKNGVCLACGAIWGDWGVKPKKALLCSPDMSECEELDLPKPKRWKPKEGKDYYYIGDDGEIYYAIFGDCSVCYSHEDFGNCFETTKQAKIARDKIQKLLGGE